MNLKLILEQVLKLVKAYRAGKRGQKQVAGVANLFGGMVGQLDAGIREIEDAKTSLSDRIDELTFEMDELDDQSDAAVTLRNKLKELTS
jgi:uncharacterized phage infection (PIP) family protein YhgE